MSRMRFLDYFVKCIGTNKGLVNCEEVEILLKSKQNDLEKTYNNLTKQSTEDINNKFKEVFPELA